MNAVGKQKGRRYHVFKNTFSRKGKGFMTLVVKTKNCKWFIVAWHVQYKMEHLYPLPLLPPTQSPIFSSASRERTVGGHYPGQTNDLDNHYNLDENNDDNDHDYDEDDDDDYNNVKST